MPHEKSAAAATGDRPVGVSAERMLRRRLALFAGVAITLSAVLTLGAAEAVLRIQAAVIARNLPAGPREETHAPGNTTGLPLRGPQYAFEPGQFKILTIGDSFTWGDGIWAAADVWPNRLGTVLSERTARDVGVVNLAVRGYTAAASARTLRERGMALEPDLILYGFYINDALYTFPDGGCLLWDYDLYTSLLPGGVHDWWDAHSVLYSRANSGWIAYQIRTDPVGWNRHYSDGAREWAQFREALRTMGALAWDAKVPVAIVLWPDWAVGSTAPGEYRWEALYAKVADAAAMYGIHVVDLSPVFAATGRPSRDWCVTRRDCHPSVEAHHMGAEVVADFVLAQGIGPAPEAAAAADVDR